MFSWSACAAFTVPGMSGVLERALEALEVALPRALGASLRDPADAGAGVVFPVVGLAVTPMGTLHAAALAAVVEAAGFLAVLPTLGPDEHAVTHHIATQLVRPALARQRVEVLGRLERRTRGLAFVSVTARSLPADAGEPSRSTPVGPRDVAYSQITKSIVSW